MYFYIDESGNSGSNLFDLDQPYLYYGVLSSKFDLDIVAQQDVINLKNKLSVSELHANELGNGGLVRIIDDLGDIYQKYDIYFDCCRLNKKDFAIISFFDQVFDQGVNPAVPWNWYWTPLRYPLLLAIAELFDDDLANQAWKARININSKETETSLVDICEQILLKASCFSDKRLVEIISDAMKWVIKNPSEIGYNVHSKENILQVSPNITSFQSVIFMICHRIEQNQSSATKIIVDIQSQFNKSQNWLTKLYQNISNSTDTNLQIGPFLPSINLSNMPSIDIDYKSSDSNVGLQLVDIHLWICRRFLENKNLANSLNRFFAIQSENTLFDEISLTSISERWAKWFCELSNPLELDLQRATNFAN
ncbi:DUF3800 domain-containing protein [Moraxella nasovis]|uniref:DUF3800 domain-containing protein n=1 Tax=Moraxella nasovis TaxID=2904121 RepID=UPI001F60463C|nr:DUF3800 domain-containing protein [Moraxella nasovis]UNU73833.1 DUF3800 domain-containing protein [Moraxella nasovis]